MSLIKLNQGKPTVLLISVFVTLLYAVQAFMAFGILKAPSLIFSSWWEGIIALLGGSILLLETYFEGAKPNYKRMGKEDRWAMANTVLGMAMLLFGIVILMGMTVPIWALGIGYSAVTILLARELIFD